VSKQQWGLDYSATKPSGTVLCLMCNKIMAVQKGCNIQKYYKSKHTLEYKKIWDSEAKTKSDTAT